jgi:hypothetical protein
MTMLSRGKVLAALAVLTILLLPPSLLAVTSAPAHAATAGTLCRHTFIPSPNVGSGDNGLDGVVTISSSDAWAVGEFSNGIAGLTLVEHWDGANWSVIPAVNFGSALTEFFGVTSIAPDDVWAVDDFQNTGPNQPDLPLTEHWNGTSWSALPAPISAGLSGNLHGVAAANSLKVWAVGEQFDNSTIDQTLTERWTPFGWQVLNNPPIGTNLSALRAISAPKSQTPQGFAWAVGGFFNTGASSQTLTELIVCVGVR